MSAALVLDKVGYHYGAKQALKDVSFSLNSACFCALLGPNGAGKSTLFSLLTRLFVTDKGQIEVAGHNLAREPRAALSKIGVVFQQPTLDLDMSVLRNMHYFAALHGLFGAQAKHRIDEALDRLEMRERAHEKVRALNGGHRRRMEIARALVHRPQVLLLDEPTIGLDATSRKAITAHVHDLAAEGLGVLWATHLVDEVRPDDDVVVLHQGQVLLHDKAQVMAGELGLLEAFTAMTATGEGA